jgi:hypothetical protein
LQQSVAFEHEPLVAQVEAAHWPLLASQMPEQHSLPVVQLTPV